MYALIDCNNFFVSCERVFNPKLNGKPVAVLSSNDGCIIARSNEAKALGIPMGAVFYQWREKLKLHDVVVCSSNFALYADMSRRVMQALETFCPNVQAYSIDEAFLYFEDGFEYEQCKQIRAAILQWTGIPVSIGVASTKTLAKVATYYVKKRKTDSVMILQETDREAALADLPVEEIWGIGRKLAQKLYRKGIRTALEFTQADDLWIRKNLSVVGLRTAWELRGTSCLALEEEPEPKKSIICSRAFGRPVTEKAELYEAVSAYAARAAEKLRKQNSIASHLSVFISLHPFQPLLPQTYQAGILLPEPTAYTPTLIHYAKELTAYLHQPGSAYRKAGICLNGIVPENAFQGDLFAPRVEVDYQKQNKIMHAMDALNKAYGRKALRLASEGLTQSWFMKQTIRSQCFTTHWNELLSIHI